MSISSSSSIFASPITFPSWLFLTMKWMKTVSSCSESSWYYEGCFEACLLTTVVLLDFLSTRTSSLRIRPEWCTLPRGTTNSPKAAFYAVPFPPHTMSLRFSTMWSFPSWLIKIVPDNRSRRTSTTGSIRVPCSIDLRLTSVGTIKPLVSIRDTTMSPSMVLSSSLVLVS